MLSIYEAPGKETSLVDLFSVLEWQRLSSRDLSLECLAKNSSSIPLSDESTGTCAASGNPQVREGSRGVLFTGPGLVWPGTKPHPFISWLLL